MTQIKRILSLLLLFHMHAYKCHQNWHIIIHIFRLRIYASHAHSQTTSPIRIFTTSSHLSHTLSRPVLFTRSSPGIFPTLIRQLSDRKPCLYLLFQYRLPANQYHLLIALLGNHIYLYLAVISDPVISIWFRFRHVSPCSRYKSKYSIKAFDLYCLQYTDDWTAFSQVRCGVYYNISRLLVACIDL
jgi:hypothetical protein